MRYIDKLFAEGFLCETQRDAAARWAADPMRFFLAPSAFRVMHDAIIKELGAHEIESRNNLTRRSAKAIIRLILNCLIECDSFFQTRAADRDAQHEAEIKYLQGIDHSEILDVISLLGVSGKQAQLFNILRSELGKVLSRQTIHNRLYFDLDDAPPEKLVDVYVCKLRRILTEKNIPYVIETQRGVGFCLKQLDVNTDK